MFRIAATILDSKTSFNIVPLGISTEGCIGRGSSFSGEAEDDIEVAGLEQGTIVIELIVFVVFVLIGGGWGQAELDWLELLELVVII